MTQREPSTAAGDGPVTSSGIPLKPFYRPEDAASLDYERDLGDPGQYPYTRGVLPTGYRAKEWTVRQVMGVGTAEETNERLRYLLSQGQTGISLTGMGYAPFESADPRAEGLVGKGGVWIDTLYDMETVFQGIDIGRISINQTGNSIPAFAMILAVAEKRGVPWTELRGTIQNYFLPWGDPPDYRGNHYVDISEFCARYVPRWNHSSVSVRNQRETGISAAQEIGFALYIGATTLRSVLGRGVDVDMVAPRITFFLNSFDDFLEEVAKFRAARRMWARLLRERFGARDPRSCVFRFHVQTSGVSLTAQQPLVNIIRSTIHALAAVLGGAQSMSVNGFDEVIAIPTRLAQTLSIRTQQVIAYESGVTAVADPLGGSWCIERLTEEVEKRAWQVYEELDRLGPERAWPEMSAQGHDAAYRRQLAIDRGEKVVVGVNRFVAPPEEDDPILELLALDARRDPPFDPAWREKQIRRLMQVKQERDETQAQAARRRLQEAYRERANILPPTIEAVKAYLSIGEICEALAEVEGWETLRKRGGFLLRLYG